MKEKKGRQRIALAAVILLAALYLATFVAAIADTTASGVLFRLCLVCTVLVPFAAWMGIWLYGRMSGRQTIADLHLMQSGEEARDEAAKRAALAQEEVRISHMPEGRNTREEEE